MTWRYCVTLTRTEDVESYEIRELYTDEAGSLSWTERPVGPEGSTWLELSDDMAHISEATLSLRVLDITDPENPQWKIARLNGGAVAEGEESEP
jgi:hypothetical protein